MRAFALGLLLCSATVVAAPLDPDLASRAELAAVPGLDDVLVEAVVDARPYTRPADLHAVLAEDLDAVELEAVYTALFRPLDLNSATSAEIGLIPGMSDRMVHEFEEYRPYASMEQFRAEIGKYVDDAEVERLAGYVFVPVSLNDATEAEIMAIPGMTSRMVHEFEEYRPYRSMDQFRAEIGKYVDDAELARLESYVTLD